MKKYSIGIIRQQPSGFGAFIPHPFPPEGGFEFPVELIAKNAEAAWLVGKLDGITTLLPNVDFFLLMYLRKDAASSSQIEGTLATMVDAIQAEVAPGDNIPPDVDDILHYIKALRFGMRRVKEDRFPLSLRFIRELHKVLASGARASHFSNPGEFRKTQNWIGGTRPDNARFVPPPASEVPRALGDLENFIHDQDGPPVLIKAGLIHAQFETIHPFLDGNGRTGRMLITFYLWQEKFLDKPVLYLSSWFKRHQQLYYEKLEGYHDGLVVEWLDFFLDGVIEIAGEAIFTVERITALRDRDYLKIQSLGKRSAESACVVLPQLFAQPIVDAKTISAWTGFTRQGTQNLIDRFINLGILFPKDTTAKYGQLYVYQDYLDIFIS
jgi:Fic family protein